MTQRLKARTFTLPALIGAGLLLAGCSTDVVGSEGSSLTWVNKADYQSEVMYLDLAVSTVPRTAAEIGDTTYATPVRLGFYEGVAVAWFSPDGELYEDRDHFVGAWPIYADAADSDGSAAEASIDPSVSGSGITDVTPGTEDPISYEFAGYIAPEERTFQNTGYELPTSTLPFAFLNFAEDFVPDIEFVIDIHPGCL